MYSLWMYLNFILEIYSGALFIKIFRLWEFCSYFLCRCTVMAKNIGTLGKYDHLHLHLHLII